MCDHSVTSAQALDLGGGVQMGRISKDFLGIYNEFESSGMRVVNVHKLVPRTHFDRGGIMCRIFLWWEFV